MTLSELQSSLRGKTILVTGHTGFKGSWLSLWLHDLGAKVVGAALPPETEPSLFDVAGISRFVDHNLIDVRDQAAVHALVRRVEPEIVFHLAAQSLVRRSYAAPVETFMTNVMGTAHVLDAVRDVPSVKAVVVVTSDKCYENHEWPYGYRESDAMGGADPYSASKGAAEVVTGSFRRSFFGKPGAAQIGSGRAGNVVGGGDWSQDRLIPDIVRAVMKDEPVVIRNPGATRPWQHVLEPLYGYMLLAGRMLKDGPAFAEGWNFGPDSSSIVPVRELAGLLASAWGKGAPRFEFGTPLPQPHEAHTLSLDISKARSRLNWRPKLTLSDTVSLTVDWYKAQLAGGKAMEVVTRQQINGYMQRLADV